MHDARDAAPGGGFGDGLRGFDVQRVEVLLAVLVHHSDEVHDCVSIFQCGVDRVRKAHVRLHKLNLPDIAHYAEFVPQMRASHRNTHAVTALRESAHNLFTDEAGTAEHNDEITAHELLRQHGFSTSARCSHAAPGS